MVSQNAVAVSKKTKHTAPVVSFVGRSESGKTTLLERVVSGLRSKGCRVAVIKHSPHGFDIDQPGKDTWRLANAGSDVVAISSPDKMAFIEHVDKELTLSQIEEHFRGQVDIILTEGYKNGNAPKILVLGDEQTIEQVYRDKEILAVIPAHMSSLGVPQFDDEDVARVVNLLIERIDENESHSFKDVSMEADSISGNGTYRTGKFEKLLAESEVFHGHICPGQVLGVRMAMRGCCELGIERPKESDKSLLVYVEIDRCATDAIQVVTGCKLGKRTMKYVDYGKLAATFVDLNTMNAVRLVAREDAREGALLYYREGWTRHEAEVAAYKEMTDEELFYIEHVQVQVPADDMPGPPLHRVTCDECGEGVNDRREVIVAGKVLCRSCAYGGYYRRLVTSVIANDARSTDTEKALLRQH